MFKIRLARELINKKRIRERGGVAIILCVMLLSMLLTISLGIAYLMTEEVRMSSESGRSVAAFYAADSGAEACLYKIRKTAASSTCDLVLDLDNQASYTTFYNGSDELTSLGQFQGISRKVELTW